MFGYHPAYAAPAVTPLPRVWPGRGLAVPEAAVAGLLAAVTAVTAADGVRRRAHGAPGAVTATRGGAAQTWARPRTDPRDRYVYVEGPVGRWSGGPGYQPTRMVTIALADLPGLRRRLAAQQDDRRHRAEVPTDAGSGRRSAPTVLADQAAMPVRPPGPRRRRG